MTRVAMISANLGAYDVQSAWPAQHADGVTVAVHRFTDFNLPPRPLAMTSRLQCGIPKWWGAQMAPGADAYIWIDASCTPRPGAVRWFLDHLGDAEIAVFRHPERSTIRDEYLFMRERMARAGETYLNARYRGEWLTEQYDYIAADAEYVDNRLYASTAFVYRPTASVTAAFQMIWALKARFLLHDQLAFPYALATHGCRVNVIDENYLQCDALEFVRRGRRRSA